MAGRPKSRFGKYERISLEIRDDLLGWLDEQPYNRRALVEKALIELKAKKESDKMTNMRATLEKFLASDDFKFAVIAATKASWAGNGYSVELYPDETWRILWNNHIGNRYESPGRMLTLPVLDTDDMAEYVEHGVGSEDNFLEEAFYDSEEGLKQELREQF